MSNIKQAPVSDGLNCSASNGRVRYNMVIAGRGRQMERFNDEVKRTPLKTKNDYFLQFLAEDTV